MGSLLMETVLFLCAITFSKSCDPPTTSILGRRFQIAADPKNSVYFLRHRINSELWIDRFSEQGIYQLDSSFDIVPGLAGVGVSFRSVNYPDYYIHHSGFKCYINQSDGSSLFRNDATYIARVGLADHNGTGISFESVNYPGHFIRHKFFRIHIDRIDGSNLFRTGATWYLHQLKGVSVKSEWHLIDGNHKTSRDITFDKMEGLEVGNSYSTSYGINTENSWKDAIEGGSFASIGCSIKAMFKANTVLKSVKVTGDTSWTKLSKRGNISITNYKPMFIWQLCLYGITSDGTLIISKTSIYAETLSISQYNSIQIGAGYVSDNTG